MGDVGRQRYSAHGQANPFDPHARRSDRTTMNVQIDHALEEIRRFRPSPEFAAQAVAGEQLYDEASADRLGFWADQARSLLTWTKPFTQTLDWSNPPFAKWFHDGELNVAANCLDRHVERGLGDRVAIH